LGVVELQTKARRTEQSGGSSLRHVGAERFSELTGSERTGGKPGIQHLKWVDVEHLKEKSLCLKE